MPLSDIVNISISVQAVSPVQAGFGEPMILAADAPVGFTQRLRHYVGPGPTALGQMVTDGFSITSATYLAVSSAFAQNPSPVSVAVGRLANLPTWHATITPTYQANYTYGLGGTLSFGNAAGVTAITAASGGNLAAACTAIAAAITALAVAGITATGTGTTVTIAGATPGTWYRLATTDSLLSMVLDNTDPGVTADLAAISLFDSSWYGVSDDSWGSAAVLAAVAAWTESNLKFHVSQTADTGCANNTLGSGSDIMQTLKTSAYTRTGTLYVADTGSFAGMAWMGARLPKAPGSENWMFATLAGVAATPLTGTQVVNIKAKFGNYYYQVAGVNITASGYTAAGSWLDLTRGRDWLTNRLQTRIFGVLTSTGNKVPYTDQGIAQIEGEVRAMMQEAIDQGFLASTPFPTVTAPTAANATTANRSARILAGVTFQAQSAGAIDTVTITGVVLL